MSAMPKESFLNMVATLKFNCEQAINAMRTAEGKVAFDEGLEYFSISSANIRAKIQFADLDEWQKGILETMQNYYNYLCEYVMNAKDNDVEIVLF